MNKITKGLQRHIKLRIEDLDKEFDLKYKPVFQKAIAYYNSDPGLARRAVVDKDESHIFIPRTAEQTDSYIPRYMSDFMKLAPGDTFIKVIDFLEGKEQKSDLEGWLMLRFDKMRFNVKGVDSVAWMTMTGTGIGRIAPVGRWRRGNPFGVLSAHKAISPFDYRVDNANDYDDAADEILSYKMSFYEILSMAKDKKYENFFIKENIEKISEYIDKQKDFSKTKKNIKIREWWGYKEFNGRLVMTQAWMVDDLLSEPTIIMWRKDPFKNGKSPVVLCQFQKYPGRIWGKGIPELLFQLQDELNERRNSEIDIIDRVVAPMMAIYETAFVNSDEIKKFRRGGFVKLSELADIDKLMQVITPVNLAVMSEIVQSSRALDLDIQARLPQSAAARGTAEFGTPPSATEFQGKLSQSQMQYAYNIERFYQEYIRDMAYLILDHDKHANFDFLPEYAKKYEESVKAGLAENNELMVVGVDPNHLYLNMVLGQLGQLAQFLQIIDQAAQQRGEQVNWQGLMDVLVKALSQFVDVPLLQKQEQGALWGEVNKIIENARNGTAVSVGEGSQESPGNVGKSGMGSISE